MLQKQPAKSIKPRNAAGYSCGGLNACQFGLFEALEREERVAQQEAISQSSWRTWGWPGPAVGRMCEIDEVAPETVEGGRLYAYTEQARLIEHRADGKWVVEIAMPGDWFKNGRRVVLSREWIGPPRRLIKSARNAKQAAA